MHFRAVYQHELNQENEARDKAVSEFQLKVEQAMADEYPKHDPFN